jgi:transposase-like protein
MSGFSPALVRQQLQSAVMLRNASRTMPLRDWKGALNRFTIRFEERMLPD